MNVHTDPALRDCPMKQPGCGRRNHELGNRLATGGFAEDGDVVRVTAEGGDVAFHPPEGFDLVQ